MKYLLLILFSFLLSGCVMAPKQPTLHDFGFAHANPSSPLNAVNPDVIVDAPTWLWDNRIRYRLLYASPTQVGFYALDQWLASPPELFQQQLIANGNLGNYSLRIQLLALEQQFVAAEKARVVLNFSITAYSAGHKARLRNKEFNLELPTQTADASGAIAGFSQLTKTADQLIHQWLLGFSDD